MSAYHTKEQYDKRQEQRKTAPPLDPLKTFYHVACLNHWKSVVKEQLSLIQWTKLPNDITACVLGTPDDAQYVTNTATALGLNLKIASINEDLQQYEHPTICQVYDNAKTNPNGTTLYIHTKGVSARPNEIENKTYWRRMLQKYVIANWKENYQLLKQADIVGWNWIGNWDYPHYGGNFWIARNDWLSHLEPPAEYKKESPPNRPQWGGGWKRWHCEAWIGSQPWHYMVSHNTRNTFPWEIQNYKPNVDIDGYKYEETN